MLKAILIGALLAVSSPACAASLSSTSAEDLGSVLSRKIGTNAKVSDLGCEIDGNALCHTLLNYSIRVVAIAKKPSQAPELVAIYIPTPLDKTNLVLTMAVTSALLPEVETPRIRDAFYDLFKKAARLSRDPSVVIDQARLTVEMNEGRMLVTIASSTLGE
ncbi:hypothetical protein [Afifella marina]|uniref:hypothetical protein n=1 Tax=Afifella marina TaxID=1080 RepID=UPI000B80F052|nr:hypothetical protein [Afifella marina]MBK1625215.1 hypothetical protein [Afifella marina DSM 2698]MBK1628932.1 hypothetical protein [Afifella marina]MBK5918311.1 hypothetical protein [Afifella marina]RAI22830.1 hypothetical protein CH311_04035 [Afifella marina DSM 2698]